MIITQRTDLSLSTFIFLFFIFFYHLQFTLFNLMQLLSWEQTHSGLLSPPLRSFLNSYFRNGYFLSLSFLGSICAATMTLIMT